MLVAVTGAGGHLGANVVRDLLDHNIRVIAADLSELAPPALVGLAVDYASVDVLNSKRVREFFQDVDVVIHLAAIISINGDPDGSVMKTNVIGTRNVASICLEMGIKKLIHVSSIHAFKVSKNVEKIDENSPKADKNCFIYDQSKSAGEREIQAAVDQGLNATIINPTGLLGPHDYNASLAGQMLSKLFQGTMPALVDAGFDWVDVQDVAAAIRVAIADGKRGEQYLLSGKWVSFKELAVLCEKVSKVPAPHFVLPLWLAFAALPFLWLQSRIAKSPLLFSYESLVILRHSSKNCSSKKAHNELGFEPKPLSETILNTYKWNCRQRVT